jgi:hypothetical protein
LEDLMNAPKQTRAGSELRDAPVTEPRPGTIERPEKLPSEILGENQGDGAFDDKKKKKGEDFDETVDDVKDPSEEEDDDINAEEEEEQDPDSDKDKA